MDSRQERESKDTGREESYGRENKKGGWEYRRGDESQGGQGRGMEGKEKRRKRVI